METARNTRDEGTESRSTGRRSGRGKLPILSREMVRLSRTGASLVLQARAGDRELPRGPSGASLHRREHVQRCVRFGCRCFGRYGRRRRVSGGRRRCCAGTVEAKSALPSADLKLTRLSFVCFPVYKLFLFGTATSLFEISPHLPGSSAIEQRATAQLRSCDQRQM